MEPPMLVVAFILLHLFAFPGPLQSQAKKIEDECLAEFEFWGCQSSTRKCQRLCENFEILQMAKTVGLPQIRCQMDCEPACVCEAGYLRNGDDGECIYETDCPGANPIKGKVPSDVKADKVDEVKPIDDGKNQEVKPPNLPVNGNENDQSFVPEVEEEKPNDTNNKEDGKENKASDNSVESNQQPSEVKAENVDVVEPDEVNDDDDDDEDQEEAKEQPSSTVSTSTSTTTTTTTTSTTTEKPTTENKIAEDKKKSEAEKKDKPKRHIGNDNDEYPDLDFEYSEGEAGPSQIYYGRPSYQDFNDYE